MSDKINVTFITYEGEEIKVQASIGKSVLDVARESGAPLPGACEGSLACSTCHVIVVDKKFFEVTKTKLDGGNLSEEEEDLLDMAPEVTPTSRLGCQIILTEDMDGLVLKIPSYSRNE